MSTPTITEEDRNLAIALVRPSMKMEQEGRDGRCSIATAQEIQQMIAAFREASLAALQQDYAALLKACQDDMADHIVTKIKAEEEIKSLRTQVQRLTQSRDEHHERIEKMRPLIEAIHTNNAQLYAILPA